MFLKNELTELLGIRYPILGGTMMDLSLAPFVTAISKAGALGVIASVIYKEYDHFRADLRAVKDATDNPFAVNINLFPMMEKLDNLRYLEIMAEEGVKIVETSGFAPPEELLAKFKEYGFTWLHKCVGVRYAKKAASLGADAVIVVGYENGGATGNLNVTTLVLVPRTVDEVNIPVVGGGGVMDGRAMLAVMALGASGVILGTRLMLSEECPIHSDLKKALLQANELDTDIIMRSVGFAHRIWMNSRAKEAQQIENSGGGIAELYPHVSGEAAREMYETGDLDAGTVSCSQAIGLAQKIQPVEDIIAEIVADAEARAGQLSE